MIIRSFRSKVDPDDDRNLILELTAKGKRATQDFSVPDFERIAGRLRKRPQTIANVF